MMLSELLIEIDEAGTGWGIVKINRPVNLGLKGSNRDIMRHAFNQPFATGEDNAVLGENFLAVHLIEQLHDPPKGAAKFIAVLKRDTWALQHFMFFIILDIFADFPALIPRFSTRP